MKFLIFFSKPQVSGTYHQTEYMLEANQDLNCIFLELNWFSDLSSFPNSTQWRMLTLKFKSDVLLYHLRLRKK